MNLRLYVLGIASLATMACASRHTINVEQFGAIPDDGINDFDALRKASQYCRKHKNTDLVFPAGVYDIANEQAMQIERNAINGAYGDDPQGYLFRHDAPYVKALDLADCQGLRVRAEGATLLLHGWYEVLSIVNAKDISIEGLSIRYNRPPSTVGRVVECGHNYFDITIDPEKYRYFDKKLTGRLHFYDSVRNRLYSGWYDEMQLVSAGRVRLSTETATKVGDYAVLRHGGHYRPAVLIKEAEDVTLKDVKIHSQPGMGVVGHLTHNITLDGLQVVPEPGAVISTNTDATHFTSCSGKITIKNCIFRGQGDDCTNIHNYYQSIYPISERRIETRVEGADLHALSLDYPSVGDTMVVVSRNDMSIEGKYVVEKVDTSIKDWKVEIELDRPLQLDDYQQYSITNYTRFPSVELVNNSVHSHLARAFLIKSRNVLIKGNSIVGSTGTAIKLGAELSWNESGPAENIIVEDNYISGCAFASRFDATCITLSTEAPQTPPFLNRNIIIRNNIFDSHNPEYSVVLRDAEDVILERNFVASESYVIQDNCQRVTIK